MLTALHRRTVSTMSSLTPNPETTSPDSTVGWTATSGTNASTRTVCSLSVYSGEASPPSRMDVGSWPIWLALVFTWEDLKTSVMVRKGKIELRWSEWSPTDFHHWQRTIKRKQTNGRQLFMEEKQMPTMGVDSAQTREPTVGRDWCCGSSLGISFLGYAHTPAW